MKSWGPCSVLTSHGHCNIVFNSMLASCFLTIPAIRIHLFVWRKIVHLSLWISTKQNSLRWALFHERGANYSSGVVSPGVGKEERDKGVVASSMHVLQGSRWLQTTFVKKRQKALLWPCPHIWQLQTLVDHRQHHLSDGRAILFSGPPSSWSCQGEALLLIPWSLKPLGFHSSYWSFGV